MHDKAPSIPHTPIQTDLKGTPKSIFGEFLRDDG